MFRLFRKYMCTWNALPVLNFTQSQSFQRWRKFVFTMRFSLLSHNTLFQKAYFRIFMFFCFCFHAPYLSRQLSILMYSKHGKVHFKAGSALNPRVSLCLTIACFLIKEVLLIIRGFVYFVADKNCQGNHLHLRQSEPSSISKLFGDLSWFFSFFFLSQQSSSWSLLSK